MENIWRRGKPLYCCSYLCGHILSEGCTDGTCRSERLASAVAGAENLHAGEHKVERGIVRSELSRGAGRDECHRQAVC